jgi:phospholipid/cholesterol/gamma-HCH transport system substrate-binding protein
MKSRLEWKVGLFVLVGLVLLGALMIEFSKGMTLFKHTYSILLRAENVGGLKMRAVVLMSGVQVGTVSDITLAADGRSVTIQLSIYDRFRIHRDARFVIQQSGFLGDQYVGILPTKNELPVFTDGAIAVAEAPLDLQEVARSASSFIQHVDETARKLNETIADVRRLVLNQETLTNLARSGANLRTMSERAVTTIDNLNTLVVTNGPNLASAGSNLVYFSQQLNQFAAGLSGVLVTNEPSIQVAAKNIESSTVVLKNLLDDVQAGKGLMGDLLRNEELAASLNRTADNLSITSSNLNRLGLWGILWQHKPSKTNPPASPSLASPKTPFD